MYWRVCSEDVRVIVVLPSASCFVQMARGLGLVRVAARKTMSGASKGCCTITNPTQKQQHHQQQQQQQQ